MKHYNYRVYVTLPRSLLQLVLCSNGMLRPAGFTEGHDFDNSTEAHDWARLIMAHNPTATVTVETFGRVN